MSEATRAAQCPFSMSGEYRNSKGQPQFLDVQGFGATGSDWKFLLHPARKTRVSEKRPHHGVFLIALFLASHELDTPIFQAPYDISFEAYRQLHRFFERPKIGLVDTHGVGRMIMASRSSLAIASYLSSAAHVSGVFPYLSCTSKSAP